MFLNPGRVRLLGPENNDRLKKEPLEGPRDFFNASVCLQFLHSIRRLFCVTIYLFQASRLLQVQEEVVKVILLLLNFVLPEQLIWFSSIILSMSFGEG